MKPFKIIVIILLITVGVIGATYLRSTQNTTEPTSISPKIKTTATFYPLTEFVRQVGGDKVEVTTLVPSGSEPHSFEPTPQDIITLQNSRMLVYNGANFEPWLEKIKAETEQKGVTLVQATEGLPLLVGTDEHAGEEEHAEEAEEAHTEEETAYDPHVWLDPVLSQQIIDKIASALATQDPENAQLYQSNATDYKQQLAKLDSDFSSTLQSCKKKEIITSHNAFAYLANRYNFEVIPISGLSPEEEPTPQKLAEIVQAAKEHDIKYIFFESLVSPRLSDTIATEVGAQTLVFNPIEGLTDEQVQQGENYLSIQNQNLQNLKTALECS